MKSQLTFTRIPCIIIISISSRILHPRWNASGPQGIRAAEWYMQQVTLSNGMQLIKTLKNNRLSNKNNIPSTPHNAPDFHAGLVTEAVTEIFSRRKTAWSSITTWWLSRRTSSFQTIRHVPEVHFMHSLTPLQRHALSTLASKLGWR